MVQAIFIDNEKGFFYGGSDSRGYGIAVGF
jgi:hypothetical protein